MKRSTLFLLVTLPGLIVGAAGARADAIDEKISAALRKLGTDDHAEGLSAFEAMIPEIKAQIARTPNAPTSHYQLGRVCFYLDRDHQAAAEFDKAIELAPSEAEYHFMRAVVAHYMGDADVAIASLKRAAELAPNRPDILCELGEVLFELDRPEEATTAFEKALKLDTQNLRALNGLADIHLTEHHYKKALPLLQKVVTLAPQDFLAAYNLGQTHQNLRQYDASLEAFRKALAIDGTDWRTRAKIIQNLEALGKTKERDEARSGLLKLWKKDRKAIKSEFYCRDQFEVMDRKVMVFEYFAFEGPNRVRYSFNVTSKKTGEHLYRISLGSYEATHENAAARGLVTGDQRYCHLDRYSPNGTHEAFEFFRGEPTYDKTKSLVIEILNDELAATSSTTPTP